MCTSQDENRVRFISFLCEMVEKYLVQTQEDENREQDKKAS